MVLLRCLLLFFSPEPFSNRATLFPKKHLKSKTDNTEQEKNTIIKRSSSFFFDLFLAVYSQSVCSDPTSSPLSKTTPFSLHLTFYFSPQKMSATTLRNGSYYSLSVSFQQYVLFRNKHTKKKVKWPLTIAEAVILFRENWTKIKGHFDISDKPFLAYV